MKVFVINLDRSEDRWAHYENTDYIRWSATDGKDIEGDILTRMISTHNIKEHNHRGKCGCFLSHVRLWKYIIDNKIDDVLILEDDAEKIREIPNLPKDSITYLGGILFEKKITDGVYKGPRDFSDLNEVDNFKILMTMSYYIPNHKILKELYDFIMKQKRYRAIDIMLNYETIPVKRRFVYPAVFKERKGDSTIDGSFHQKYADLYYRWIN